MLSTTRNKIMASVQLSATPPFASLTIPMSLSNTEDFFIKNLMVQLKAHDAFYVDIKLEKTGEVIDSIVWFERFLNQEMQKLPSNSWLLRPFEAIRERCRAFGHRVTEIQYEGTQTYDNKFDSGVEEWRGDRSSDSTPRSSNRTGGFPASGSRTRKHRGQAWDRCTPWVAAFGS